MRTSLIHRRALLLLAASVVIASGARAQAIAPVAATRPAANIAPSLRSLPPHQRSPEARERRVSRSALVGAVVGGGAAAAWLFTSTGTSDDGCACGPVIAIPVVAAGGAVGFVAGGLWHRWRHGHPGA